MVKMQMTKEFRIQLGLRIREARKKAGLTQEQLAEQLEMNKKHISNMECGKSSPSLPALIRICQICEVSSDLLLFGMVDDQKIPFLIQRACQLPERQLDLFIQYTNLFFTTLSEKPS